MTTMKDSEVTYPPHLQRVKVEFDELSTKIAALTTFMFTSPIFEKLDDIDKGLLTVQVSTMRAYAHVLQLRLAR